MTCRVRRSCRWSLTHSGKWFCKLPAVRHPGTEPLKPLDEGCPKDCSDVTIVPWKKDLYGDDYDDGEDEDGNNTLDVMPPVKVVEWDEET